MERHFDEELAELKHMLVKMAGTAEQMINDAVHMLVQRDASVRDTVNRHEHEVNQMQCDVDDRCTRLIALHQPTASDLRIALTSPGTSLAIPR